MLAMQIMSALSQPTRLRVFSELAAAGADGLPAGAIAEAVEIPANTLSPHLAILSRAGLVTSVREGRSIVYNASADPVVELMTFLIDTLSGDDDAQRREFLTRLQQQ